MRFGPAFTGLASAHVADGAVSAVLAEVGAPGHDPHPASRLSACTPRCWTPASSPSRPTPQYRAWRTVVCCCRWACDGCVRYASDPQRPLLLDPGNRVRHQRRGRHRCDGRTRQRAAGGARTADGHRGFRDRRPRSAVERAATHHRVATARTTPSRPIRRRKVAAGKHFRHRRHVGTRPGRRVEAAGARKCVDHALAAARP